MRGEKEMKVNCKDMEITSDSELTSYQKLFTF